MKLQKQTGYPKCPVLPQVVLGVQGKLPVSYHVTGNLPVSYPSFVTGKLPVIYNIRK